MTKKRIIFSVITLLGTALVTIVVLGFENLRLAFGGTADSGDAGASAGKDQAVAVDVPTPGEELVQQQTRTEAYLAELQASESEYAAQIEEANQKIEELNAALAGLELEVQASDAEVADYESEIGYASYIINGLNGSINQMQNREAQFVEALNQANQNIVDLQAYLDQYHAAQASLASNSNSGGDSTGSRNNSSSSHHDDDHHEREEDDDD
jgi:chromosome segregation ATPase